MTNAQLARNQAVAVAAAVVGAVAVLGVLEGFGLLAGGEPATLAVGAVFLGAMVVATRPSRSTWRWPWLALAVALGLLLCAGLARAHLHTVGNLTASRSLVPDAMGVPGSLLAAVAVTLVTRGRAPRDRADVDMVLDALIFALASLAVVWAFVVDPILARHHAPGAVRVVVVCSPVVDLFMVAMTGRLLFDRATRRAWSGRLLAAAVVALFARDAALAASDLGLVSMDWPLFDALSATAVALFGGAALHPSARLLELRRLNGGARPLFPTPARLFLVTLALIVPTLVVVLSPARGGDRLAVTGVAVVTAAVTTWRVFRALRSSASSEAKLAHQATHDELTGLPNRVLVEQWVSGMLDEPGLSRAGLAVVFLDIDRFKLVNDTFGHANGDVLLGQVARRIGEVVGPRDIVARIGGDEFVIVLENVAGTEQARQRAERIRRSFDDAFFLGQSEVFVTASLGVSLSEHPEPVIDAETLIRDADTAMYQAKEAGRDTVSIFDASMRERIADRLSLEHDLRLAVEREEFRLVYQPIISLAGRERRVIGLEALLRWEGPARGLVPPGMFIGIAEDSGLIVEIDDWVIHEACRQLASWRQEPDLHDLFVSVNVSALQLKKAALLPRIRGALAQSRLSTEALCIELTESLLMESPADGTALLTRLKELGVRLALDDFGTGYSSLAYLRQFPVDYVKVDQSFTVGLARQDPSDETLVAAIVSMARALGAATIAEGVEEPRQEDRLRAIGADCAQGFYYSRPVPAERVVETIRSLAPRRGLRLVSGDAAGGRRGR